MTLQVAFVGSDGFVMASDRKVTFWQPSRYSSPTGKFAVSDENGIVCAHSGDEFALEAANHLIGIRIPIEVTQENLRSLMKKESDIAWQKHVPRKRSGEPGSSQQPMVLVGLMRCKEWPLWRIVVKESSDCVPTQQKAFAGDQTSGATFFAESFYSKGPLRPVHEVLLLAVQTILEGNRLNPTYVSEEFDLIVCKDGKLGSINTEEIEQLKAKTEEIHQQLKRGLFENG